MKEIIRKDRMCLNCDKEVEGCGNVIYESEGYALLCDKCFAEWLNNKKTFIRKLLKKSK